MDNVIVALQVLMLLGLAAGVAFVRSYLPSYVSEKAKNLATKEDIGDITDTIERVRAQHTSEVERLKFELAHAGNVQRYQYEVELRNYQEIWEKLVDVQWAALNLRPAFDTHEPDETKRAARDQQRLTDFADAFNSFNPLVHKRRPFIPQEVFDELDKLRQLTNREATDFSYTRDARDRAYWEESRKNAQLISDQAERICTAIRERLRRTSVA